LSIESSGQNRETERAGIILCTLYTDTNKVKTNRVTVDGRFEQATKVGYYNTLIAHLLTRNVCRGSILRRRQKAKNRKKKPVKML